MNKAATRNGTVDALRGVAILLVVLGHTLFGSVSAYEDSLLMNVIWTLQMPLFMLISGFVTRFGRGADSLKSFGSLVARRTLAYLLPWVVWTFGVHGLVLGEQQVFRLDYLLWHMDNGYWFLTSLWTISLIFGTAQFFAARLQRRGIGKIKAVFITGVGCLIGAALLTAVGLLAGISFFGIKLTLYYLPFFFAGYLFGQLQKECGGKPWFAVCVRVGVAVCAVCYAVLLSRFCFFDADDSPLQTALRIAASFTGCAAVAGLLGPLLAGTNRLSNGLQRIGRASLEIYLVHGPFLALLPLAATPTLMSARGMACLVLNYAVTLLLSCAVILLVRQNRVLNKLLFWKS